MYLAAAEKVFAVSTCTFLSYLEEGQLRSDYLYSGTREL